MLLSEVRIKEKEKNCSAVCKKNIYVYIKTCGNSQTIISSSGYEVCLENYQAIDKDCVNVDGNVPPQNLQTGEEWARIKTTGEEWARIKVCRIV